ncbi:MAG: hypothetical protein ACJ76F_07200, partial [Bacteroidia bacterium]
LFALNPDNIDSNTYDMHDKYGNYYYSFIYNVINQGDVRDSVLKAVGQFISDPDMRQVYKDIQSKYRNEDIEEIGAELTGAFRYFKYHFPQAEMPKYYTSYISGFNFNVTTVDSTLGIGLDMYLGPESKYYQMLQWPRYKTRVMDRPYIVPDCMRGWIIHTFDKNEPINNLLNHMIFYGKMYYCLDAVLPDSPDSMKIGYSAKQMKYCNENEKNLWAYFTTNDRLYKNDLKEVAEYTSEGPFTAAISKECPPRIAMWVGLQIVRAYMDRNPDVTVAQLMSESDAQKILTKSKYKP